MSCTFIPLGGFLGAGKTTLMLAAAERLRARGLTVACVTNDQGDLLVDSNMVEQAGVPLGQVRGGCFCCRFNELADTINEIVSRHRPDIILAEAVGSCTDLTATVIRPLKTFHGDNLRVRPLTTVIDPLRLADMLADPSRASAIVSEETGYLYRKQLEEGSCLLLNKTDLLPEDEVARLSRLLQEEFGEAVVLHAATVHGQGVDGWLEHILSAEVSNAAALDIDYDLYADGEAQLGWLNAAFTVEGSIGDVVGLCSRIAERLSAGFDRAGAGIAHLKLWAQDQTGAAKISVVRNAEACRVDLQPASLWSSKHVSIWLNARIRTDPTRLQEQVQHVLQGLRTECGLEVTVREMDCFAPSRPSPTYRMA